MRPHLQAPRLHQPHLEGERHATWLELFFDLVFVVAITQLSEQLSNHLSFVAILQFIALFVPVVWAWVGHTVYSTRFDTDDIVHRVMTFVMMFAAAIMTVQIPTALGQGANGFAFGYILARIVLLLLYLRIVLYHLPNIKQMTVLYLSGFGLGVACWVISMFSPPPIKFWWWALGLVIDFLTPWIGKQKILSKLPISGTHIPERFGLFTIIVLGECVAAVILGLTHANMHWKAIVTSILAFILAILIWLQYYSFMLAANYKCNLNSGQSFMYTHYPLVISLVLISVSVEHTIIAAVFSTVLPEKLNIIFCSAIILWLLSFFLLQYITTRKYNVQIIGLCYLAGIVLISILFLISPLLPLLKIMSLDIIFSIIVGVDLFYIAKKRRTVDQI